jgi:transcriptional regulator with XRE-family HTH domain
VPRLRPLRYNRWHRETETALRTLWAAGYSYAEIAEQLNRLVGIDGLYTAEVVGFKWRRDYEARRASRGTVAKIKIKVKDTCPPVVRDLIEIVNKDTRSWAQIARKAGISPNLLVQWQRGVSPRYDIIERCFAVVGFELVAVQREVIKVPPVVQTAEYKLLREVADSFRMNAAVLNPKVLEEAVSNGYIIRIGAYVTISQAGYDRLEQLEDN